MIDGNLAALRAYEKKCDEADETFEMMEAMVHPLVNEIEKLYIEAMGYADYYDGYDYTDDIVQMINDVLER